jgi:glycosyltransferase involved in cell wall biosynthesis
VNLSVVVPAYNEAARINDVLRAIEDALSVLGEGYEVVVVDDGSSDGTRDHVAGKATRLIIHEVNRGKASAVQTGLAATLGRHVVVLDADLEYLPHDILAMLEEANRHTTKGSGLVAVYGSRYLEPTNFRTGFAGRLRVLRGQEITSWIANWVLTTMVLLLFGKVLTDTLTGLKLYPGDFLREQRLTSTGFEGDHEITAKLIRAKVPITEVPISYRPRSRSEGKKIGPRDGVIAILTFLKFRFR